MSAQKAPKLTKILSASDFSREFLLDFFARVDMLVDQMGSRIANHTLSMMVAEQANKIFFNIYYENSTRTRVSFDVAGMRLGMHVVTESSMGMFSSVAKGETLADTLRVLSGYKPDVIALRHNQNGELAEVAHLCDVPLINAGDGDNEHPTQALIDMYTIYREMGKLTNLSVVIGGDLRYGRTARSLALLLSLFEGNKVMFVSLPELRIDQALRDTLQFAGLWFRECEMADLNSIGLQLTDVVYWTRPQLERMKKDEFEIDHARLQEYVIDSDIMQRLPLHARVLHPLPRTFEMASEVDLDPRAAYFRQSAYGVPVRMALLNYLVEDVVVSSPELRGIPDVAKPWQMRRER